MREYITEAVVLDREDIGEADARIFLYTKEFGKIAARAKSIRKITSKLASHLQPLTLITARLVEKNSFQIVDALALRDFKTMAPTPLALVEMIDVLRLVREVTASEHPDARLWDLLSAGNLLGRAILKVLGFDPEHATCESCGAKLPSYFILQSASYLCKSCLPKIAAKREYFRVVARQRHSVIK